MTRPTVREKVGLLPGYHSPQVDVEVRLNTNESPLPPPPSWFESMADAVSSLAVNRYPDREATKLREAIAAFHGVSAANVFCGNGSNEVLQSLLMAYGGEGRTVVTFEPTYALHSHIANLTATTVVSGERDSSFGIPTHEIERIVPDADVVFLCSPNNPTGVVDSPDVLERVLQLTRGLVVVDEAYGQFATQSAIATLDDELPLAVVRTFSKTWAMAGVRLGYLLGPPWVVDALWKVALPYHLSMFTQTAGLLALHYETEMQARVGQLVAERERVSDALRALPVHVWPSSANFVLFRPETYSKLVWQRLLDRSVLVRDCSSWPRLGGCLRVTIGTPEENDRFLEALKESL